MVEVSATRVKQLRSRTGAGIMDCKNALVEAGGDEDKAVEIIQKKGLAKAAKKAGAIAAEGVVHAYVHPGSRIGVLVEVNCQTDFVARNDEFRAFADDIALQIASMAPLYVSPEDLPPEHKSKQAEIFRAQLIEQANRTGKKHPDHVVERIVEGRLEKWLGEACLLEQPFIRDNDKTIGHVADLLTAKLGERISVRRFVRFELGEGIEKKKNDLAKEVAEALAG